MIVLMKQLSMLHQRKANTNTQPTCGPFKLRKPSEDDLTGVGMEFPCQSSGIIIVLLAM